MLKKEVLAIFKELHRTRNIVFEGDTKSLEAVRQKINEAFILNKTISDLDLIRKEIKFAHDVNRELRHTVIQAVIKEDGNYELKMRKDIELMDTENTYKDMPSEMIGPFESKKKCSDDRRK